MCHSRSDLLYVHCDELVDTITPHNPQAPVRLQDHEATAGRDCLNPSGENLHRRPVAEQAVQITSHGPKTPIGL